MAGLDAVIVVVVIISLILLLLLLLLLLWLLLIPRQDCVNDRKWVMSIPCNIRAGGGIEGVVDDEDSVRRLDVVPIPPLSLLFLLLLLMLLLVLWRTADDPVIVVVADGSPS
jgi:hypothetical protein